MTVATTSLFKITSLPATKHVMSIGAAVLLTATLSLTTSASAGQPANCGPRAALLKQLANKYSEAPVAVGLSNSGALVEVLTSERGDTWTILVSKPDGTSCLVAAGQEWQALKHVASSDPSA
jgi:hypothetical protein